MNDIDSDKYFIDMYVCFSYMINFVSSIRRHTRCALVTRVQTFALPIYPVPNNVPLAEHIMNYGFDRGFDWSVAKSLVLDHGTRIPEIGRPSCRERVCQ